LGVSEALAGLLWAIADKLNEDRVPTGRGGAKWHASTVKAVACSP